MTVAMKAADRERAGALRLILSELQKAAKDGDHDEVAVLRRERKRRRDAQEAFEGAGRAEQAGRERAEGDVVAGYLPAQLDDADLAAIVADVVTRTGATGMKDMGRVMGAANAAVAGRAEGGRVAAEVRRQLTG